MEIERSQPTDFQHPPAFSPPGAAHPISSIGAPPNPTAPHPTSVSQIQGSSHTSEIKSITSAEMASFKKQGEKMQKAQMKHLESKLGLSLKDSQEMILEQQIEMVESMEQFTGSTDSQPLIAQAKQLLSKNKPKEASALMAKALGMSGLATLKKVDNLRSATEIGTTLATMTGGVQIALKESMKHLGIAGGVIGIVVGLAGAKQDADHVKKGLHQKNFVGRLQSYVKNQNDPRCEIIKNYMLLVKEASHQNIAEGLIGGVANSTTLAEGALAISSLALMATTPPVLFAGIGLGIGSILLNAAKHLVNRPQDHEEPTLAVCMAVCSEAKAEQVAGVEGPFTQIIQEGFGQSLEDYFAIFPDVEASDSKPLPAIPPKTLKHNAHDVSTIRKMMQFVSI